MLLGKVKRRIWKLPNNAHNKIIHNIAFNIHIILEKRLIKFMHSALNGNEMCKQILCVKLRCKNSSFVENYRYLSWKYNFSDCNWFTNIAYLIGEVKIEQLLSCPVSHSASVLDITLLKVLSNFHHFLPFDCHSSTMEGYTPIMM